MGAPLSVAPGEGAEEIDRRLTPAMSSRKLRVLDFVKRYFAQWGQSPSYGEIAAALGISRQRAYDLVRQLSIGKQLEVVGGKPRGIRLPDRNEELSEADIILRLARSGFTVLHGDRVLAPPDNGTAAAAAAALAQQLTRTRLSELLELDHVPAPDQGDGDGDQ